MTHSAKALILAIVLLPLCSATHAQPQADSVTHAPADYALADNWLCLPGREDACNTDLSTTVVAPDGTTQLERWSPNPNAAIDCFYVYPTVSNDPGGNSDLVAGPEEISVVQTQLARFGSACRLYAPLYQQITLTALLARLSGQSIKSDAALAYTDVASAWQYYLEHYNRGRGVVLIGHSQGSGMLKALAQRRLDGKPDQQRLVSALLLGTNVAVPEGKDVGADFDHIPLCRSSSQIGCIVSYVTFRDNSPPPSDSRFGRLRTPGLQAGCTNPAALAGGTVTVAPYFPSGGLLGRTVAWAKGLSVDTPSVSVPGLLSAQCVVGDGASYLSIHLNADPADPRADDIPGDVVISNQVVPSWGLHLVDVSVAMGDLIELVGKQALAYLSEQH